METENGFQTSQRLHLDNYLSFKRSEIATAAIERIAVSTHHTFVSWKPSPDGVINDKR